MMVDTGATRQIWLNDPCFAVKQAVATITIYYSNLFAVMAFFSASILLVRCQEGHASGP